MAIFSIKNLLISLLLLLAVALSGWSIVLTKQKEPTGTSLSSNQPDAYMENVETTIFNQQGLPSLKVSSPQMTHFPKNDMTKITKPHVILYRQSPEPWTIDADFGTALHGTEQITFLSNVVIHHTNDVANPTTTMKTASLTIFPHTQIAKTGDPVTIVQPDVTVHAIGMLANLEEGTVKLLAEAKGDYVPSS